MSFEMIVGLRVVDHEKYAEHREANETAVVGTILAVYDASESSR